MWRQTTRTEPEEAAAPHAHLMFGRKTSTVRVGTSSAYVNEQIRCWLSLLPIFLHRVCYRMHLEFI